MRDQLDERALCRHCFEPATGVLRSSADDFIYKAVCLRHGESLASDGGLYYDHWRVVLKPVEPLGNGGVRYRRGQPHIVVHSAMTGRVRSIPIVQ